MVHKVNEGIPVYSKVMAGATALCVTPIDTPSFFVGVGFTILSYIVYYYIIRCSIEGVINWIKKHLKR